MTEMREPVILGAVRTRFAKRGGGTDRQLGLQLMCIDYGISTATIIDRI